MKQSGNRVSKGWQRLVRSLCNRPLRLLWFAPLLMAFESPGCVMSEEPLTRFQRGSIDDSIIGQWAVADASDELALTIGIADSRRMEFLAHEDDGSFVRLTGFVSRFRGQTYANLQFMSADCTDCSDAERTRIQTNFERDYSAVVPGNPNNSCTWLILPFEHADGALWTNYLAPEMFIAAIEAGEIEGSFVGDDPNGFDKPTCIRSSQRQLRRYIDEHLDEILIEDLVQKYVRYRASDGDGD